MVIVDRFHRVRAWNIGKGILSPSLILDTKKNVLAAYDREAWAYHLPHLRDVCFRGGVQWNFYDMAPFSLSQGVGMGTMTNAGTALNSNYTSGSAGACTGGLFWHHIASNITDIYYRIASYTGTAANVNDINVEVRTYDFTNHKPTTGAPGLTELVVSNPASATGWIKVTGFNAAPTANARFFVVVGDPDGNGTDCANVTRSIGFTIDHQQGPLGFIVGACNSTNGFSTISYAVDCYPALVLVHANGSVQGNSNTALANHTSNAVYRGNYFGDVPFSCKIFSCYSGDATLCLNAVQGKVFDSSTGPGGTELYASSSSLIFNTLHYGAIYARPFPQLRIGNAYRIVLKPTSGNWTGPQRFQIGTGVDDNLRKARAGYGSWYQTDENAGNWTDTTSELSAMGVVMEDITPDTATAITVSGQRSYPRVPLGY